MNQIKASAQKRDLALGKIVGINHKVPVVQQPLATSMFLFIKIFDRIINLQIIFMASFGDGDADWGG